MDRIVWEAQEDDGKRDEPDDNKRYKMESSIHGLVSQACAALESSSSMNSLTAGLR